MAKLKLVIMPAEETNNSPFLMLVKFRGLTGTGLAQPKMIPGAEPGKMIEGKIQNKGGNYHSIMMHPLVTVE